VGWDSTMPPPPWPAIKDESGLAGRTCNVINHRTRKLCKEDVRALADLLDSLGSRSSGGSSSSMEGEVAKVEEYVCGQHREELLCFKSLQVPRISVLDYLIRFAEFFRYSPACYVVAAAYIDRVLRSQPDFVLDAHTVHRLLLASLVVAVKFSDDVPLKNSWYAQAGGVTNRELNVLEVTLLKLLDWRVHVSAEEYDYYCGQIWPVEGENDRNGQKRSRELSPCQSQQPFSRRCRRRFGWPGPEGGPEALDPFARSAVHCRGPPRRAHSAPVGYAC